jgi:magnesium chelatase family protein
MATERGVRCNAELSPTQLDRYAALRADAAAAPEDALRRGTLSGRGLHRVRRVARTIADLDGRGGDVTADDVAGAIGMRVDPSFLVARLAS